MPLEEILSSVPAYVPLAIAATVLLYWYGTSTFNTFKKMGVRYESYPLPFIGNLYTIFTYSLPELDKGASQTMGKIYGSFQGRTPVLCINEAESIKQVTIKEFHKFTNRRPFLNDIDSRFLSYALTVVNNDHWKHLRTVLTPTFTSGKLKNMFPAICNCADKLVEHVSKSEERSIPLKPYTSGFAMDVIAQTAFGLDLGTQEKTDHPFIAHAATFFGIPRTRTLWSYLHLPADILVLLLMPKFIKKLYQETVGFLFADKESEAYMEDIIRRTIQARTADNGQMVEDDFLSMINNQVVDLKEVDKSSVRVTNGKTWTTKGITNDELLASAVTFLTAGYDTTASALQFLCYSMATNPEIQQQLYEEISALEGLLTYEKINKLEYLDCCIHESLRMFPSLGRFDRVASEDAEVNGLKIPKGTIINVNIMSVHYDPEYWPDPHVFSPDRFRLENRTPFYQYTWLPFGLGGRSCIAQRLALLELKVAAFKLLKHYKLTKTPDTVEPDQIEYVKANQFVQPKSSLQIGMELRTTD